MKRKKMKIDRNGWRWILTYLLFDTANLIFIDATVPQNTNKSIQCTPIGIRIGHNYKGEKNINKMF